MITGRIYSDAVIENPSRYLDAVFGRYWTSLYPVLSEGPKCIGFTAGEETRRVCEVSRNIEITSSTWADGSPVPCDTAGNRW